MCDDSLKIVFTLDIKDISKYILLLIIMTIIIIKFLAQNTNKNTKITKIIMGIS